MYPRIRLRSRVLVLTGLYAAMLFAIVFVLTWRARSAQREAHDLIAVDLRVVAQLEDVVRNQSAFAAKWRAAAAERPNRAPELSSKYGIVSQLLEIAPLASLRTDSLLSAVRAYEQELASVQGQWRRLAPAERRARVSRLDLLSAAVIGEASSMIAERRRIIDTRLPALARSASGMSAIALGVSYIIVIVSFAIASVALTRVVKPVEALVNAAERIAAGDLDARAPIAGDHEVAQLGTAFNRMAEEISRARAQLEERARTDELTGLPNFRALKELLDQEIKRASRYGESFGVLVADLDHFKQYNDRYGHAAGNEALKATASAIRASIREADSPARYGGEEFVIILPNSHIADIAAAAERVRAAVEALPAPKGASALTVTIGAAVFPADGTQAEQLFGAADARLYEGKSAGRNRVTVPAAKAATRSA